MREGFVRPAGVIVIALEAGVGMSFLGGGLLTWGAAGAMLLLGVFGFVVGSAKRRGIVVECNCFGPGSADAASPRTAGRMLLLGAGVILVLAARASGPAVSQAPSAATVVAGGCVLVAIAVVLELPAALRLGAVSETSRASRRRRRGERR